MSDKEIIAKCMVRIQNKYERRGKAELWTDDTYEEFLRAFALISKMGETSKWTLAELAVLVVDELLMNPPTDDRGREINWLPDPSDIVRIARKMTAESGVTPSDVVSEILGKIEQFGMYGQPDPNRPSIRLPGPPALSPLAKQVAAAMGGWMELCVMEAPMSVINGLLLKHAQNSVEREAQRLILANGPKQLTPGIQKQLSGNGHTNGKGELTR